MKLLLISILVSMSSLSIAGDLKSFCAGVPSWAKGADVRKSPGLSAYTENQVGKPVDAKFGIDKLKKEGWVVIDARDKGARKASGKISGALLVTADYKNKSKNEFEIDPFLKLFKKKKFKKHLKKRKIAPVKSKTDLKNFNYVVFCNGFKCHRSSFGACKLREHGVPMEKVHILLGGFDELKAAGAKIK